MAATREQVAELVMRIFDRLEHEFPEASVEDAVLLVELNDPTETIVLDDFHHREVPSTIVLLDSTSDRLVVQSGIIEFASRVMFPRDYVEDED